MRPAVDSPGLRPADPQPCAPRRIPVRTAPNREPDRLPTNLAPHGCGAMTRPKPPAVIPGRSRAAAEGKGIQQGDAVAQRRCFVLCKEPLRGDILTLDPLPLRRLAPPAAGDDSGRASAASIRLRRAITDMPLFLTPLTPLTSSGRRETRPLVRPRRNRGRPHPQEPLSK